MNHCSEYAVLLSGFVDGTLSSAQEAELRAHLAVCPACGAELRDLLAIHENFPGLEDAELPEGFTASVMAAVRAGGPQRGAPAPRRSGRRWWRAAVPLAACVMLLAVLGSQHLLPFGDTGAGQAARSAPPSAPQSADEGDGAKAGIPSALMTADEDATAQAAADTERDGAPQDAAVVHEKPIESLDPAHSGLSTAKNTGAGMEDAEYAAILYLTQEEAAPLLADRVPELTSETEARYVLPMADALPLLPQAEAAEDGSALEETGPAEPDPQAPEVLEDAESQYVLIIVTLAQ